ncbi:MAG: hypothetical protein C0505_19385 [Leptothrix sp. (in: Bacteria)]|nr:hypothetical protein [Leptothrix sp. (in: b-proteobacteria)]
MEIGRNRFKLGRMTSFSTSHSSARRPRRPGDVRHDPDAVDAGVLLDDRHPVARRGSAHGAPVVCQELLLLRAGVDCPECGERTPVFAMMGLPEFEVENAPTTLLRRISTLPAAVDKAVREFGKGRWRRDHSAKADGAHWHSHCARCAARLDESFTLSPDGPFRPRRYKERMAIKVARLPGPFVLEGAQRQPSLPMLDWLEWLNQREAKARAMAPRAMRTGQRAL